MSAREWVLGQLAGRLVQRMVGARSSRVDAALSFPEVTAATLQLTVPTRSGPVSAEVFLPPHQPGSQPPGLHVNFHGGGYVMGDPRQDSPLCRCLAAWAGLVVVNVDYPLAPQHPFPAAVHQGYDVVRWLSANAGDYGWDGRRTSVGGQSAGGGLAAAVARQALEGGGPSLVAQVLHYPPLDLVADPASKRAPSPDVVIRPRVATIFNAAYVPAAQSRRDPLASPALSDPADLVGIAPALVITAERDRLRDEAVRYAEVLAEAGSLLKHRDVAGVDHGYNVVGGTPEVVRDVYELIARTLTQVHSAALQEPADPS